MLRTRKKRVDQKALLNSGATECFIHPQVITRLGLDMQKLQNPHNVRNVDGTPNKAGKITEAVDLVTQHQGIKITHVFFIVDIGPDDFILGYPFLEASMPIVNWADAKLEDTMTLSTLDANKWQLPTRQSPQ